MVTKEDITSKLKAAGVVNVSMSRGNYFDPPMPIKTHDNKFIKGIKAGSIGPITVTDAYKTHNSNTIDKLVAVLKELPHDSLTIKSDSVEVVFVIGVNQIRTITFDLKLFPTNAPSVDLDSGYKTYWLVQTIKDSKVKIK
jgi:hypothetical protein